MELGEAALEQWQEFMMEYALEKDGNHVYLDMHLQVEAVDATQKSNTGH